MSLAAPVRLFHYCSGNRAWLIMRSGCILPAPQKAYLPDHTLVDCPGGGEPLVWLSSNSYWERTHTWYRPQETEIGTYRSREETAVRGYGLCRFGVREDMPSVLPFRHVSWCGMTLKVQQALGRAGRLLNGNPDEWYVTPCSIWCDQWQSIEWLGRAGPFSVWIPFENFVPSASWACTVEEMRKKQSEIHNLWDDFNWDAVSRRFSEAVAQDVAPEELT